MSSSFISVLTELAHSTEPFTDIRLEQDAPVFVRYPNGWRALDEIFPPSIDDLKCILTNIDPDWDAESGGIPATNRPIDLSMWRLRINTYLASGGNKVMMTIRRIPRMPLALKEIGLPPVVRIMLTAPRGLILISGATRSGKSTTAAAMIDTINEARAAHIITIEDPIEYVFENKKSIFSQREVGIDTPTFQRGLEDAMRQCPDVILVGEIRNRETAETALLAGESGHLVIGTLHANTGAGAVQKMLGWFNDNERSGKLLSLSGSLVGIVNQVLLPRADGSGYALAAEIINNYEQEFSNVLGDPSKVHNLLDRSDKRGSVQLAASLADLANRGVITKTEAGRAVAGMGIVGEKLKQLLSSSPA